MMLLKPAPHKEAAKFIQDKPAVTRAVFNELLPELQARAFTVTGIESANVLQDIRDRIADLPLGGNWDEIKAELAEKISPFLTSDEGDPEAKAKGKAKAERRAELLIRLHGFQAYSASAYRVMDRQRDVFPFWMYRSMGDGKVRDSHAALNGKILPSTSPFWQKHYPPWEWACRCQAVPMMEADVDEIRDAEKDRPVEERRVMEGAALESVEQRGTLVSGPNKIHDLRTPSEKGKPGGFEWSPGDLTLTPDQLRSRYSPEIWTKFEAWAKAAKLSKNRTVWDWMNPAEVLPPGAIPASLQGLTKVKDLGGTTGAELWKTADGRRFVVKRGNSAEHLAEEFAADQLYRALGVPVPPARMVQTQEGPAKIAQFIEGKMLSALMKTAPPAEVEAILARVREHFAADALLGNWDVAGTGFDNILVDAQGVPWRIDNGGSLRFRAQGARKTAEEWGSNVQEIDTLRDPRVNSYSARIFAQLGEPQIKAQITKLLAERENILKAAPDDLRTTLAARLDSLAARLSPPGTVSPKFAEDVQASRILGRTYLGDKDLIEDHSVLFWQEAAGAAPVTRAKLRLTEAGWRAVQANLGDVLSQAAPSSYSGPAPLPVDVFWPSIEKALKTVNTHATDGKYNAETIKTFKATAAALTAFQAKTAPEKAMKAAYTAAVADVEKAMQAKAATAKHKQFVQAPPPPQAPDPTRRIRATAGEMIYEAKDKKAGHVTAAAAPVKRVSGAYTLNVGDIEMTVAPWAANVPYAHRGVVMIKAAGAATPERLEQVLSVIKEVGVDARPTPPATSELLYLRKTLQLAKPAGEWQAIADGPEDDAEKLAKLRAWTKSKLKIDPATSPVYDPNGRANAWGDGWKTWQRFDLPAAKLRAELPGYGLTHNVSGNMAEVIDSILNGGGQFTPTMERLRVGVPIDKGASPDADQGTGGANYIFTRIASEAGARAHRGMVFKIDLLARADAFSFKGDRYGDVRPAGESTHGDPNKGRGRTLADFKTFAKSSSNETIFKNGLSLLDDIDVIRTGSPQMRKQILDIFTKHKITTLPDGRSIESVVL